MAPRRLLIVTVTKGFRHEDSIPLIEEIVPKLGAVKNSFTVDFVRTDEDMAKKMTPAALKDVDGVLFGNTTGDLPLPDRDAFVAWVASGKAFIGTHSATDTFHSYKPYLEMIGAEFKTHGPQVKVNVLVADKKHPATRPTFAEPRDVFDEIYQFQNFDPATFHELLYLDKHPNTSEPGYYPLSWCKRYGKGRVFYTALGHRADIWQADWYQTHLLGGIHYALGLERGDDKPQKGRR